MNGFNRLLLVNTLRIQCRRRQYFQTEEEEEEEKDNISNSFETAIRIYSLNVRHPKAIKSRKRFSLSFIRKRQNLSTPCCVKHSVPRTNTQRRLLSLALRTLGILVRSNYPNRPRTTSRVGKVVRGYNPLFSSIWDRNLTIQQTRKTKCLDIFRLQQHSHTPCKHGRDDCRNMDKKYCRQVDALFNINERRKAKAHIATQI